MAIEVEVVGTGSFRGSKSNLTSYSVDEAITPLDASSGNAGVGTVTFGATEAGDSTWLLDNEIKLSDGARGEVLGRIRSLTNGDTSLRVTADSVLIRLNSEQRALPYNGTLGGALTYYMSLVGITGGFQVDPDVTARPVVLPGWTDNVLESITQLCVAQQIEMSVVYQSIVFREPRSNEAVTRREKSTGWSIDRGSPALSVEAYEYNYRWLTNALVYPNAVDSTRNGFQVDSGETLEPTTIRVSASLTSVVQPTPVAFLPPNYTGGAAYVVLGSDGLPIPVAEWNAKGGLVRVSIDPQDASAIIVDVTGMTEVGDPRAPYQVGIMSSGNNTNYPAFYVTGTGAFFDKTLLRISTGATDTQVAVGATIDNRHISTRAQLLTALIPAVRRYSGLNYSISGDAVSINRMGAGNEFATSKLSEFDSEFAGQKLSALDARGWTFADFDEFFASLVSNQFENQLFGNAGGARVARNNGFFRVDTATTTESAVTYSASLDTLMGDWDATWAGKKLAEWDATWIGHKLRDWEIQPLRTE